MSNGTLFCVRVKQAGALPASAARTAGWLTAHTPLADQATVANGITTANLARLNVTPTKSNVYKIKQISNANYAKMLHNKRLPVVESVIS